MTAILHDCIEDANPDQFGSHLSLYDDLEERGCPESVIKALRLLTHTKDEAFIEKRSDEITKSKGLEIQLEEDVDQAKEEEYLEYIKRISMNDIARMVKIEDLRHNSDIRRLKPDAINGKKTAARIVKYGKALQLLTGGKVGYV